MTKLLHGVTERECAKRLRRFGLRIGAGIGPQSAGEPIGSGVIVISSKYRLEMFAAGLSDYQAVKQASMLDEHRSARIGLPFAGPDIDPAVAASRQRDRPADALFPFRTKENPVPREALFDSVTSVRMTLNTRKLAPKGRWCFTMYVAEDQTDMFWIGVHDVYEVAKA